MKSHFFRKFYRNQSATQWKMKGGEKKKSQNCSHPTQLTLELIGRLPRVANAQSINGDDKTCVIKPHCKVLRMTGGKQIASKCKWSDTSEAENEPDNRILRWYWWITPSRRHVLRSDAVNPAVSHHYFHESASQRTANFHMYKLPLIHDNKGHYTPGWLFSCN